MTDPNGVIRSVNRAFTKLTGYQPREVIGKNMSILKSGCQNKKFYREMWQRISTGKRWSGELVNRRKDRLLYSIKVTILPVFDDQNQIAGFVAVQNETTASKQAEAQIKKSQRYQKALIQSSLDMIISVDLDRRIVEFNAAAEKIFGYTKKEVLGKSINMLYANSNQSRKIYENIKKNKCFIGEVWNRKKCGGLFLGLLSANQLRDESNKLIGFMGISRDITAAKQAELALRDSEKRFQDITHSMADWAWEVDNQARYTFASGRVKKILGYSAKELIGKTPFDLMPKTEADKIKSVFAKITKAKKPIIDLENWNRTKDGRLVCLLTSGVPILDKSGRLVGYRGVDKDVTARRKTEQALRDSQQEVQLLYDLQNTANQSQTFEKALSSSIKLICHSLQAPIGHVYFPSRDYPDLLISSDIWSVTSEVKKIHRDFIAVTCATNFGIGEGLPGRVLAQQKPIWVSDVSRDKNFPRNRDAKIKLGAGCALPIFLENKVAAVLEFFFEKAGPADPHIMQLLLHASQQFSAMLQKRRIEDDLWQANLTLRTLIHASPLGIVIFDPAGRVASWNPETTKLLGWKEQEVLGHYPGELSTECPMVNLYEETVRGKLASGTELNLCHKDGRKIEVSVWTAALQDRNKTLLGVVAVIADDTKRKQFEAERNRLLAAIKGVDFGKSSSKKRSVNKK